jgi:hypothetical protein
MIYKRKIQHSSNAYYNCKENCNIAIQQFIRTKIAITNKMIINLMNSNEGQQM